MRITVWLFTMFLVLFSSACLAQCPKDEDVFELGQTSASMLIKYAEQQAKCASPPQKNIEEKRYLLLYDIYIKAHSYAFINKVFFILSIVSALAVLLWPSLSIVFKSKLDTWQWLKSATVQTTVTAIAALMFTFYSQYKDKQTYAETLMRYVIHSQQHPTELAVKVAEELARIDRGFSFNSVINDNNQ